MFLNYKFLYWLIEYNVSKYFQLVILVKVHTFSEKVFVFTRLKFTCNCFFIEYATFWTRFGTSQKFEVIAGTKNTKFLYKFMFLWSARIRKYAIHHRSGISGLIYSRKLLFEPLSQTWVYTPDLVRP